MSAPSRLPYLHVLGLRFEHLRHGRAPCRHAGCASARVFSRPACFGVIRRSTRAPLRQAFHRRAASSFALPSPFRGVGCVPRSTAFGGGLLLQVLGPGFVGLRRGQHFLGERGIGAGLQPFDFRSDAVSRAARAPRAAALFAFVGRLDGLRRLASKRFRVLGRSRDRRRVRHPSGADRKTRRLHVIRRDRRARVHLRLFEQLLGKVVRQPHAGPCKAAVPGQRPAVQRHARPRGALHVGIEASS